VGGIRCGGVTSFTPQPLDPHERKSAVPIDQELDGLPEKMENYA